MNVHEPGLRTPNTVTGYASPGAVLAQHGLPCCTSQNSRLYQDGVFPTENVRRHGRPLLFSFAVCLIAVVISCKRLLCRHLTLCLPIKLKLSHYPNAPS